MIESLCQAYHWTLPEVMRLTMPQMIMLNHASWVNYENSDRRHKAKRKLEDSHSPEEVQQTNLLSNMSPEQLSNYMSIPMSF